VESIQWLIHLLALLLDLPLAKEKHFSAYVDEGRLVVCVARAPRELAVEAVDVEGHYVHPSSVEARGDVRREGGRLVVPKGSTAALYVPIVAEPRRVRLITGDGAVEVKVGRGGLCPVESAQPRHVPAPYY